MCAGPRFSSFRTIAREAAILLVWTLACGSSGPAAAVPQDDARPAAAPDLSAARVLDRTGELPLEEANRAVRFDLRTRELWVGPPAPQGVNLVRGLAQGWPGLDAQPDVPGIPGPSNHSALALESNYRSYPSRCTVRVFLTTPRNQTFAASGVMLDAKHVLTAGWVVFGTDGWARSIRVVPAYNGDAATLADQEPYGHADAYQLWSWSGWTNSFSPSHNLGVVELDRPVGVLTGWYGYGYDTACSFFTRTTFYHSSYPAAYSFTGARMYSNSGTFDSCPSSSYLARFNRGSYVGEWGSGHHAIIDGNRYTMAIMSGHTTSYTDCTRLDATKFAGLGTITTNARPATFDLTPMRVGVAGTAVPGGQLSYLTFLLYNHSRASSPGLIEYSIYLSTDRSITTADIRLGDSYDSGTPIAPLTTRAVTLHGNGPYLPSSLRPGTYYVGVILRTPDAINRNQATHASDVATITVVQPGSFTSYGQGCPGTGSRVPLHTASGSPERGQTVNYELRGARPLAAGVLLLGSNRTDLDLGFLGMSGCSLLVDLVGTPIGISTDLMGAASVAWRLGPPAGSHLLTQFAVVDPGAPTPLQVVVSNAIDTRVGG